MPAGGIRTHNLSRGAATTHALDRAVSAISVFPLLNIFNYIRN